MHEGDSCFTRNDVSPASLRGLLGGRRNNQRAERSDPLAHATVVRMFDSIGGMFVFL